VIVGGDTVTTALKAYTYFTGTVVETRYAAGLGLLYYVSEELGSFERALRYVRVGGVEYGEHIPLAGEPPAGRPATLTLTTHPNPFLDRVTLDLTVPSPQAVTVEVFDVLGRRVYAEEHAVSRVARLALDGRAWAPGVYVVRATAGDGQSAFTRIVRR
jgi:hypothetical protein